MSQLLLDPPKTATTAVPVLGVVSACHLINDTVQSLVAAAYPIFKGGFDLSFGQIGLLTLTYQIMASLLQPLVGVVTDRKPQPYALLVGMTTSLGGLLVLAFAPSYPVLLAGSALMGVGSSIFHPEASRLARLASGGSHGLAQSVFQVGGNVGSSLGPLLVAFVVLPRGQASLGWFALALMGGMILVTGLGRWSTANSPGRSRARATTASAAPSGRRVGGALAVLVCLMLSKWVYLASFTSYYVFYLMQTFGVPEAEAQVDLSIFLAATAGGTLIGGPLGDRIGSKAVIWGSILGVLPFTLVLPYVGLSATIALSVIIGLVLASAFSAIVVYAQDLMPGRVGMVSGLFFGLAFGMGGLGAAALGLLADWTSLATVYQVCAVLPAIGVLAALLPSLDKTPPGMVANGSGRHAG